MATVQQLPSVPTPAGRRISLDATRSVSLDIEMQMDMGDLEDMGQRSRSPVVQVGSATKTCGLHEGDVRTAIVIYGPGQEGIVSLFADILGKQHRMADNFQGVASAEGEVVIGISAEKAKTDIESRNRDSVVAINAHCTNLGMPPDLYLSAQCDHEFLYSDTPFDRRDLARFISFTMGQVSHHAALMAKPRTSLLSMTFPDLEAALPNMDILTVGADIVEMRVDLLKEPLGDGTFAPIPSLKYVGEQLMILRRKTELPILFTTRCTKENGRFPMDNPDLFYEYLCRAIQWGVEYLDVEVWLPEDVRRKLYEQRGSTRIMSAFHDFTGTFKWPSPEAQSIFLESRKYADIVKMIAIANDPQENFELEYFRSKMRTTFPDSPPLSAVNMGEVGQFSRPLNKVFTPITHPLMPAIAAPGQMSAAEINAALSSLGQMPKKNIYAIGSPQHRILAPNAHFYEKCLNELGLPHQFAVVERHPRDTSYVEASCNQRAFGGAYLSPPASVSSLMHNSSFFSRLDNGAGPTLTEAARMIGTVDTIMVRPGSGLSSPDSAPTSIPSSPSRHSESPFTRYTTPSHALPSSASLVFDNASWRGIVSTLTRELAPSAYAGATAVVLASNTDDAASTMYALKALRVGKAYTVGFKTPLVLSRGMNVEPFNSLESLQRARMVGQDAGPFVIVSALGPEKSNIVGMLVRLFGGSNNGASTSQIKKIFLDLACGPRKNDPSMTAEQNGFAVYGVADVTAFTTVETLRLLVEQNVPYDFVRLASGRGMF